MQYAAVNPNTIVVMQSLGMVEVDQFKDNPNVAGIIWTASTVRHRVQQWPTFFLVM